MPQKLIKHISRIFKDRENEDANNQSRPVNKRMPSERLLVSYDTFLENVKKHESTNEPDTPNQNWFNSISKANKWRKRRFTNPFHYSDKDDTNKSSTSVHTDILHKLIKSPNSDKSYSSKPHFSTFKQQKRPYVGLVSPELSEKVEIESFMPNSYSIHSLSQLPPPTFSNKKQENRSRSSTSCSFSSIFSKSTPHFASWAIPSDQETVRTSFTSSFHEEDKYSIRSTVTNNTCDLQQQQHQRSKLEPELDYDLDVPHKATLPVKNRIGLAEQVKAILGDAILLADQEMEQYF